MSKQQSLDGGIRINREILGPTLRGSDFGNLGLDFGIPFMASSLGDSKVQPGPGATVHESV